jgi:diketogulonate reductase-like aldo/keto reductase
MKTIRIGECDVPRIGLGGNRLRVVPENLGSLREAVAAGVKLIDTPHGRSRDAARGEPWRDRG